MRRVAPSRLLASDLDGTLIPVGGGRDPAAAERFRTWRGRHPETRLAYLTGRHFELARAGIEDHALPRPDFLGCDVGASLYRREGALWRPDEGYRGRMRVSWAGRDTAEVIEALAPVTGLVPQPPERQTEFKTSFFVSPGGETGARVREIETRLREAGIEARVVGSVEPDGGMGLVDVLPPAASKRSALDHLRRLLDLPVEQAIFCGDSGNDLDALLHGGPAVLVGNAPEDLRARLRVAAREQGTAGQVFFARREVVAGVLEGLEHFGWD